MKYEDAIKAAGILAGEFCDYMQSRVENSEQSQKTVWFQKLIEQAEACQRGTMTLLESLYLLLNYSSLLSIVTMRMKRKENKIYLELENGKHYTITVMEEE